jgi:alkylation response protein AidB-like acyl-CoA dehydrogenase
MDFEFSDELIAVRDLAREFARKRDQRPARRRNDREKIFSGDSRQKEMGELGVLRPR